MTMQFHIEKKGSVYVYEIFGIIFMQGFCRLFYPRFLVISAVVFAFSCLGEITPLYTYHVINTYPHDHNAFTQGLVFEAGFLYEGTGGLGNSTLRKLELESGDILQMHELPDQYFGEGIAVYGNKIIQLFIQ